MSKLWKQMIFCRPNPGFTSQLELFQSMGNKIDPSNPEYKMYQLNLLALRMQTGHHSVILIY